MKNDIVEIHYYTDIINGKNYPGNNINKKPVGINPSIINKHILPLRRKLSFVDVPSKDKTIQYGFESGKKKKKTLPKLNIPHNNIRALSALNKNKNIKTVPSNIKNSNNIIKLNPRLKDIPHNIERIHELNHLYYNDNKRFIVEDIKLDILNHIKLPFRYKNDEFRMTKYFKDFSKLTRISFTPSNVTLK